MTHHITSLPVNMAPEQKQTPAERSTRVETRLSPRGSFASNLKQVANPLCAQFNSASYSQWDGKGVHRPIIRFLQGKTVLLDLPGPPLRPSGSVIQLEGPGSVSSTSGVRAISNSKIASGNHVLGYSNATVHGSS